MQVIAKEPEKTRVELRKQREGRDPGGGMHSNPSCITVCQRKSTGKHNATHKSPWQTHEKVKVQPSHTDNLVTLK